MTRRRRAATPMIVWSITNYFSTTPPRPPLTPPPRIHRPRGAHVRLPVGRHGSDIAPVPVFFMWLRPRHQVGQEVIREHAGIGVEFGDDRAAEVMVGAAPSVFDQRVDEQVTIKDVVPH